MEKLNKKLLLDSAITNLQLQYNKYVEMNKKLWDYYSIDNDGTFWVSVEYDSFNKKIMEQRNEFLKSYKRVIELKEDFEEEKQNEKLNY